MIGNEKKTQQINKIDKFQYYKNTKMPIYTRQRDFRDPDWPAQWERTQ